MKCYKAKRMGTRGVNSANVNPEPRISLGGSESPQIRLQLLSLEYKHSPCAAASCSYSNVSNRASLLGPQGAGEWPEN